LTEGHSNWDGIIRGVSNGSTPISFSGAGDTKPLLSIRKKSANIKDVAQILSTGVFVGTSDDFIFRVVKNGTLTGASFTSIDGFFEKDTSATSISGGYIVYEDYVRGGSGTGSGASSEDFSDSINAFVGDNNGVSEIFTVVATSLTTTSSIYAKISYLEYL
jgi:hypothetical protein